MKTFIMEEHHEAFFIWNYARHHGLIKPEDNVLLHIDEHADNISPQLNTSIHGLNGDMAKTRAFVYQELNIASFIIPALYQGLFEKIYWVQQAKQYRTKKLKQYTRCVWTHQGMGKKFYFEKLPKNGMIDYKSDLKYIDVYLRTVDEIASLKNVILDIDLDYFSAIDNPAYVDALVIEITRDEFQEFQQNLYHPMRYRFLHNRVEAVEKDGKYFYLIDGYEGLYPMKLKMTPETIVKRVEAFLKRLEKKSIEPQIIDICRSKSSGFTPPDQCEFIQEKLLEGLSKLYKLEIIPLQHII